MPLDADAGSAPASPASGTLEDVGNSRVGLGALRRRRAVPLAPALDRGEVGVYGCSMRRPQPRRRHQRRGPQRQRPRNRGGAMEQPVPPAAVGVARAHTYGFRAAPTGPQSASWERAAVAAAEDHLADGSVGAGRSGGTGPVLEPVFGGEIDGVFDPQLTGEGAGSRTTPVAPGDARGEWFRLETSTGGRRGSTVATRSSATRWPWTRTPTAVGSLRAAAIGSPTSLAAVATHACIRSTSTSARTTECAGADARGEKSRS